MDIPPVDFDLPNPPGAPNLNGAHDKFAIAIYSLSAIGLILFIVVMIFYIITWTKNTKRADALANAVSGDVKTKQKQQ
jgi:hypothetical protein